MRQQRRWTLDPDDRRRFETLYEPLWGFATVVAPPEVEADDLLQEAMVRILSRRSLDEVDHPAAYIRKTLVHVASNHRRRMGTRHRALSRLGPLRSATTDQYPSDLSDLLTLAPKARAILYLSVVEGYQFDEIGEMLGCTPGSARKTASRARAQLRASQMAEA